ncbi:DEAD-domain-containing protein [Ramicandelaber brevisporus]|nr:DEAD-domain-containing protein [Ramicandelaber brevisporus]
MHATGKRRTSKRELPSSPEVSESEYDSSVASEQEEFSEEEEDYSNSGDSEEEEEEEEEDDSEEKEEDSDDSDDSDDDDRLDKSVTFQGLGLAPWLCNALKSMAIAHPTEIQRACVPPLLAGRDVLGVAKTGSGKTAAFALPILQKLSEDPYGVFALVLTPTRELAFQIAEQFSALGKAINLRTCVVVGGLDMLPQALELQKRPHVVIATPGRLADHIKSSTDTIYFQKLRFLVLDEADRLLTDPFSDDLGTVFGAIPKKRQTLLFTATVTEPIMALRDREEDPAKRPFVHICKSDISTVSTLVQKFVLAPSHVREMYLYHLLTQPEFVDRSVIIFVGKCSTCEVVRVMLRELGIRSTALHSRLSQKMRIDNLGRFRAQAVKILVSTDVGSRGLDIPTVGLVINFDVPRDPADYIHRVGRTARAGRGGVAVTITTERDIGLVKTIEERIGIKMAEHAVDEKEMLHHMNVVSKAKRVANMHLHDIGFDAKDATRAKKNAKAGNSAQPSAKRVKSKGRRGWNSFASHFRSEQKSVPAVDKKLFPLPLELLEEIALYFTCPEALEVLTVNSVFHDAFSHSVWSCVYLRDSNAHLITKSAWKKYGHLVRTTNVNLEKKHTLPAILMPNLVELDIYLNDQSLRLFKSAKLPHLRRLYMSLAYGMWTRTDFKKGVELAQHLKRNGQSVKVEWSVSAMTYDNMLILDEMLGMAGDTAFDSLSLTAKSDSVVTLAHLPKLALLLKDITITTSAEAFHSIFGGDSSVIFPRLEFLQLDGHCLVDYSGEPSTITPQRLPALKMLWLYTMKGVDQSWVSNVLNSNTWPSLTNLLLSGCSDSLDFEVVATRMPNLEHLSISNCSFNVDAATIVSLMPRLERLILGDPVRFSYDAAQVPQLLQHTSLKSLIFQYDLPQDGEQKVPLPLLQFIVNGAPNLESAELHGCGVSMDDLKTLSGQVNPSVRTLHIEFDEKRFNSDSVAAMVAFFPNLKKCTVMDMEHEARKVLPSQHPNLEFDFYPSELMSL